MSGKWSWYVGTLRYADKCVHCSTQLRGKNGEVVLWCDGKKYHTDCLLDKLAAEYTAPVTTTEGYLGIFGLAP